MMFVLTPDSLASTVCGEELQHAVELNKRIIPVLRRPVDGLRDTGVARAAKLGLRASGGRLRRQRRLARRCARARRGVGRAARPAYAAHRRVAPPRPGRQLPAARQRPARRRALARRPGCAREAPTRNRSRTSPPAGARRRGASGHCSAGVGLALVITAVLAVVAVLQRSKAIDREQTARAQALAAQSIAAFSGDPEESVRDALAAVDIRSNEPEALYRAAASRLDRRVDVDPPPPETRSECHRTTLSSPTTAPGGDRRLRRQGRCLGHADRSPCVTIVTGGGAVAHVSSSARTGGEC